MVVPVNEYFYMPNIIGDKFVFLMKNIFLIEVANHGREFRQH